MFRFGAIPLCKECWDCELERRCVRKTEGLRADTRVVGGIVYWRGGHEHADKEQAGTSVARSATDCFGVRQYVAGYAMVTLQGRVNEVILDMK